jgi:hypothetical protein
MARPEHHPSVNTHWTTKAEPMRRTNPSKFGAPRVPEVPANDWAFREAGVEYSSEGPSFFSPFMPITTTANEGDRTAVLQMSGRLPILAMCFSERLRSRLNLFNPAQTATRSGISFQ